MSHRWSTTTRDEARARTSPTTVPFRMPKGATRSADGPRCSRPGNAVLACRCGAMLDLGDMHRPDTTRPGCAAVPVSTPSAADGAPRGPRRRRTDNRDRRSTMASEMVEHSPTWNEDGATAPGPVSLLMGGLSLAHGVSWRDGSDAESGVQSQTPLVLRVLCDAPAGSTPPFRYDPDRQIATDPTGQPLTPALAKDWTSYESTHTDGDGGDNETWGWEEQQKS